MSDALDQPLTDLHGVGPARAATLRALGLERVRDLIEYFPRRYQFEAEEMPIADLTAERIKEKEIYTVRGEVTATNYRRTSSGGIFEATIDDGADAIGLSWFNAAWLRNRLTPGMTIRVRGKVKFYRNVPQMQNPKWEPVGADTPLVEDSQFRPIYPATAELSSAAIEKLFAGIIDDVAPRMAEWFDASLIARHGLLARPDAYAKIHRPKDYKEAKAAHRRLVYDELMLLQLGLGLARRARGGRLSAPVVRADKLLDERIRKRFGFELTRAQARSAYEIVRDMQSGVAMNRLLQGDVGSGKTAVALYAMLVAIANKLQAAILAPTEVLAEQHFLNLSRLMANSGVNVGLFTQRTKRGNAALKEQLAEGQIHIAVGTQALIQGDVDFANLGVVVVDEQHRFGVRQRATLKGKGLSPHYLVMTATPIPRTLALSFFADFDVSTIDELPPGRQPIETTWFRRADSVIAYAALIREVKCGRQAYVVVPKIDDNPMEKLGDGAEADVASLDKLFESLRTGALKGLRLLKIHGRMTSEEKQEAMRAFRDREADVLVATTVIEVGVDVPNASIMLIESAEQFGLAQLHQLRGRVGRGSAQSYCVLLSDAPTDDAVTRLKTMCDTSDGFALAEVDLKLRGPGDFFGLRQKGLPPLKVADLTSELEILKLCRDDAERIFEEDATLTSEKYRPIREEIVRRFGTQLGLASIG